MRKAQVVERVGRLQVRRAVELSGLATKGRAAPPGMVENRSLAPHGVGSIYTAASVTFRKC